MFQIVHRIVRGADNLDLEFPQDALRGQLRRGQFFVRLFPDFAGGILIEQFGDAKITLQFQMRPVDMDNTFPYRKFIISWYGAG